MANSATIILRDLTTGAGRTGLAVKLRRLDDNFAADYKTASELAGKPGVYEFTDVPFNKYKLWVNGNEETSFGGLNGRWWPVSELTEVFLAKDTQGHWNHGGGRIFNVGDPVSGVDVGDRDYNDTRYIQSAFLDAFLPINGLVLFVNAEFPSQVTGKRYQTIQAAINYAQSQGPTASSQWLIIIFDKKDTVGYAENITLQPYIHLAGWGKTVRVYGTMGGMSSNTRLYNIQWTSLGNFSVSNIRAKECSFITDDPQATGFDITLTGTTTKNCYLHATQNVLSGGSNNYLNLATSAGFEPQTTDKGSHFSLNLPQFSGNPFDI